jgi:hemerythrin-like domain-containing protein
MSFMNTNERNGAMPKRKTKTTPRKKNKPAKAGKTVHAKRASRATITKNDLVHMILQDHKPLKQLIKIMKNFDVDINERRTAFEQFAPLLVAHAKPEEKVLYAYMKNSQPLREEGFEGDVEHGLADQMLEEVKRTQDEDLLGARIKVLADLVEHHIQEEENALLPDFRKISAQSERVELGDKFMRLKAEIEAEGSDDAPPERQIQGYEEEAQVHI